MSDAMMRGVLACSVLLAVAFLVSGCAGSAISEAEQILGRSRYWTGKASAG